MAATQEQIAKLSAPTPKSHIKTFKKSGKNLSYVTARFVMNRLDESVGASNWQSRFKEHLNRTVCEIGILCKNGEKDYDEDWIWKSDGAGDTSIEGDKGGISDAFKRAAVHWGIARDLYPEPSSETVKEEPKKKATPADPKPRSAGKKTKAQSYVEGLLIAKGLDPDYFTEASVSCLRELGYEDMSGEEVLSALGKMKAPERKDFTDLINAWSPKLIGESEEVQF